MNGTLPQTEDLIAFLTVVDRGGINEAARALELPKSTISRRLARLERELGTKLFLRNRRKLQLTESGHHTLEVARRAVDALQEIGERVTRQAETIEGQLRVSVPMDLGGFPDVWISFLKRYPRVGFEFEATNRYVDLILEGFDVALRAGRGDDDTLISKLLGRYPLVAVASPSYVDEHGRLSDPAELRTTSCVLLSPMRPRPGYPSRPELPHRHAVFSDPYLVRDAACAGLGVAILPPPFVRAQLASGALVKVLDDYNPLWVPLYAVYPDRYLRASASAFIDHMREHFDDVDARLAGVN